MGPLTLLLIAHHKQAHNNAAGLLTFMVHPGLGQPKQHPTLHHPRILIYQNCCFILIATAPRACERTVVWDVTSTHIHKLERYA